VEALSQFGQDTFIDQHVFNGMRDGVLVEIGANNGVALSNTLFFERRRRWKGICIEPSPDQFAKLKTDRKCLCINACVAPTPGVGQLTLVHGQAHQLSVFSLIISTKNRVEHSMRTCDVLEQLEARPLEILIAADGCTDGTSEFVSSALPDTKLIMSVQGRGSIASRIGRCVRQWALRG
jgi:Methyltransferase FkbM domain